MLRAIFFDFNGVIVDDEFLHCSLFQKTLARQSIALSKEDYYQKYLGYDDHDAFGAVLKDQGKKVEESFLDQLILEKAKLYQEEAQNQNLFIEGSLDFIQKLSDKYYLGVVSGALKQEIVSWLERGKIKNNFQIIIAAEDVKHGKPNPEGYLKALDAMNRDYVSSSEIILPQECLVIEDSIWGIEAAHDAGMKCLALATSYKPNELQVADWVANSFSEINLSSIISSFR